jgi:glycosyltransferase involved in cell wall biosynthesis
MISVLIPVYNFSVVDLVKTLCSQITGNNIAEIVVFDDGSETEYLRQNREIAGLPKVVYKELNKNHGRVLIRKLLAEAAAYPWLLFLDSDSRIIQSDFLATYFNALQQRADVLVGGRIYAANKPKDCRLALHWQYGRMREKMDIEKKAVNPYSGFMSNNFLIKKSVFLTLNFDASLQGYGHEDTWMGIQLENQKAAICYIHNPVEHIGLETADVYIAKSENAVRNLVKLQKVVGAETLSKHIKIYRVYSTLNKYGLLPVIAFSHRMLKPLLIRQLTSCRPSLFLFDCYRLGYLMNIKEAIN